MKKFFKNIFSVENCVLSLGYRAKLLKVFGLKFILKDLSKLQTLNDYYVENPRVYLSIVCIAKNEGQYIKEWIEYHNMLGVERFYFYDNGSTDNTREVLDSYIKEGLVVYNYCEGQALQNLVYADAILKYRDQTRWMAIIDLDEFIVPVEKNNIPDFLKDYENYPAVGINWVMFDSNGHKTKPLSGGGLVTANYTRVYKDYNMLVNRHIKSIVNPQEVLGIYNPHYAVYKNNGYAVNEFYKKIKGAFTNIHSSNKIRINHYYTKSAAEYHIKVKKDCADNMNNRRVYDENVINFPESVNDYSIQKYVPELKKRMNICEDKVQ